MTPGNPDLVSFVLTDRWTKLIALPLAHACWITSFNSIYNHIDNCAMSRILLLERESVQHSTLSGFEVIAVPVHSRV